MSKRALSAAVGLTLLLAPLVRPEVAAAATPTPSPSACPSPSPSPEPAGATPNPQASAAAALCQRQADLQQISSQIGQQVAQGLAAERALQQSIDENGRQQSALQADMAGAQTRAAAITVEIGQVDLSIAALEQRIHRNQLELGRLARVLYFTPTPLIVRLLRAGSLRAMLTQAADTAAVSGQARALRSQLLADQARLNQERAQKQAALDEQVSLTRRLAADIAALAVLRSQQQDTARQLAVRIAALKSELAAVNAQSTALAKQISAELGREQQALIARSVEEAWAQLSLWLQSHQVAATPGSDPNRMAVPLAGAIVTQPFGPSDLWFEPAFNGFPHFHTGLDLAAPENTPVDAAAAGKVAVVAGSDVGYGNYVIVVHAGGLATLYGHLNQALVKAGDTVVQGQPIGLEGSTGNSTGPHLHFEIRAGGQPVDPAPFLTGTGR